MSAQIIRFGIDIGKRLMVVHGVDCHEKTVLKKNFTRSKLLEYFSNLTQCEIGIESCGGSHFWARKLTEMGHEVRLISAKYVIPYRRKGKNDANDAEAICEAIGRPGMKFVSVKSEDQQAILMAHRIRTFNIKSRTALINQIHGHMLEFGVVVSKGRHKLKSELAELIDFDHIPKFVKVLVNDLLVTLCRVEDEIELLDGYISDWVKSNDTASRLMKMEGVGALTASAVIGTVGDPQQFKNGRHLSAWLGLTPRQSSSGGKSRLGKITKKGDRYLRTLLIHGARTILLKSARGTSQYGEWLEKLRLKKPDNVVAVAMAAKQARMLWAVMSNKQIQHQPI